jgi:hypothetical protein
MLLFHCTISLVRCLFRFWPIFKIEGFFYCWVIGILLKFGHLSFIPHVLLPCGFSFHSLNKAFTKSCLILMKPNLSFFSWLVIFVLIFKVIAKMKVTQIFSYIVLKEFYRVNFYEGFFFKVCKYCFCFYYQHIASLRILSNGSSVCIVFKNPIKETSISQDLLWKEWKQVVELVCQNHLLDIFD